MALLERGLRQGAERGRKLTNSFEAPRKEVSAKNIPATHPERERQNVTTRGSSRFWISCYVRKREAKRALYVVICAFIVVKGHTTVPQAQLPFWQRRLHKVPRGCTSLCATHADSRAVPVVVTRLDQQSHLGVVTLLHGEQDGQCWQKSSFGGFTDHLCSLRNQWQKCRAYKLWQWCPAVVWDLLPERGREPIWSQHKSRSILRNRKSDGTK